MSLGVAKIVLMAIAAGFGVFYSSRFYQNYYRNKENEGSQVSEPRTARCSICLDDFRNFSCKLSLPCGHPMHRDCARLLFIQRENSCPWCRRRISPEFLRTHFPEM